MEQQNATGKRQRKSCQGLLFAVSAFFIVDGRAATWWVNDDNYNDAYADAAAYIAADLVGASCLDGTAIVFR